MEYPSSQSVAQNETTRMLLAQKIVTTERMIKSGVDTFFWIAGLSMVNTIVYLFGGTMTFVIGLGITLVIDIFAKKIASDLSSTGGTLIQFIGFVIDLAIMGLFVLLGVLGRRKARGAVLFGMILYTMDGLIYLALGDWMSFFFHLLMLGGLWKGYSAISTMKKIEETVNTGDLSSAQQLVNDVKAIQKSEKRGSSKTIWILIGAIFFVIGIFVLTVYSSNH